MMGSLESASERPRVVLVTGLSGGGKPLGPAHA